ncbi:aggregation factor core [Pontivivens insulae]|uniref:Uncharacterized protein n=1 Tax=Pontivivens insulae TaxID=1639689 RepID=A0A2R8AFC4_9RHOB|nr:aggregation factor core [Pontivivens insulae]RED12052.1 hypothetical protein DFR53_2765 [Pontivivens insulae]SPF30808.1 hypothetical protein POI8812_03152 [Pontivivens insulae]
MKISQVLVAGSILCATPGLADIDVNFREGAPKDRFTISQDGTCPLSGRLVIDLGTAPAGLIFDTDVRGVGFEVAQPFELVEGGQYLAAEPALLDGDSSIALDLLDLPNGAPLVFTIDIDNTIGARGITVTGSEIAGSTVVFNDGTPAVFESTARASVVDAECAAGT